MDILKPLFLVCPILLGDAPKAGWSHHALDIQCRVNGVTLQDSNTRELIFKIPYLIAYISSAITLMPGDIILTGTPYGTGYFRDPQVLLKSGDTVEVEIEGIGILINTVK